MRYFDFQISARPLLAFNLNDARKIDPGFHRQQLSDWLDRGFILPLTGGYYRLVNQDVNESYLFMLANRVVQPSYISLESALAYYHVIPESVPGVTSISSRKTRQLNSEWGRFSYRSVKPVLMFGYHVVEAGPRIKFQIASLEKAVLDYVYLHSEITSLRDFEGLRWNKAHLQRVDPQVFSTYTRVFGKAALETRVNLLMEYIHA